MYGFDVSEQDKSKIKKKVNKKGRLFDRFKKMRKKKEKEEKLKKQEEKWLKKLELNNLKKMEENIK